MIDISMMIRTEHQSTHEDEEQPAANKASKHDWHHVVPLLLSAPSIQKQSEWNDECADDEGRKAVFRLLHATISRGQSLQKSV